MESLKDQFITAAQNGGIATRKSFKENITEQITNALIDKLLDVIATSDVHEVKIDLTQFIIGYTEKDTGIHEDIDLREYAKIIYQNLAKHDNIFKALSKDYVVGYLSAMPDDESQVLISKIKNSTGKEYDKNIAEGTEKVINNMYSPKQIVFDMYDKGEDDIIYFNWRDFQKSAKLETLD